MERRAFHNLFVVVLVFVTTCVAVKGFHTEQCDHQSLALNVKSAAICIDKVQLASVEDIIESAHDEATQEKGLELHSLLRIAQTSGSGVVKCMDVFLRDCFQTDITGFIVQVISEIMVPRPRSKWINSELVYASPDGFAEWDVTLWRFVDFHFDKECPFREFSRLINEELIDCFSAPFSGPDSISSKYTLCDLVTFGISSCTGASRCFSVQELSLLRALVATMHNMAMKGLVRLNEKFGNFSLTLNALVTPIDGSFINRRCTGYRDICADENWMDAAVEDFKLGSACQTFLMEYSMISNSPRVLPLTTKTFFTTLSTLLSKLLIVSFAHF